MRRFACVLVTILAPVSAAAAFGEQSQSQATEVRRVFTEQDLAKLKFLEGRWVGKAPDGSKFFEEYDFPSPDAFRSRRYEDASFAKSTDSSAVTVKDGKLISTWGQFTWEATRVEDGLAEFSPLAAPSSFTWKRAGSDAVEVTQKWIDEKGEAQTYSLALRKVR